MASRARRGVPLLGGAESCYVVFDVPQGLAIAHVVCRVPRRRIDVHIEFEVLDVTRRAFFEHGDLESADRSCDPLVEVRRPQVGGFALEYLPHDAPKLRGGLLVGSEQMHYAGSKGFNVSVVPEAL